MSSAKGKGEGERGKEEEGVRRGLRQVHKEQG